MASRTTTTLVLPVEPRPAALIHEQTPPIPLHNLATEGFTLNDLPSREAHNVVEVQQTWKHPRINTWRLAAVFFAFINFGMNDACYGALIPFVGAPRSASRTPFTMADML